jgi:hypothetical protein
MQLRPWSESNNMKWRMITQEADNPENKKYSSMEQTETTA